MTEQRGHPMGDVDSQYAVRNGDWPAGRREGDLTYEQAQGVLDQFDEFYPGAVEGLAKTVVPTEVEVESTADQQ